MTPLLKCRAIAAAMRRDGIYITAQEIYEGTDQGQSDQLRAWYLLFCRPQVIASDDAPGLLQGPDPGEYERWTNQGWAR